jgi:hypothetical protein
MVTPSIVPVIMQDMMINIMIELIKLILESGWRLNIIFLVNFFVVSMLLTMISIMIIGAFKQCITESINQYYIMKVSAEMSRNEALKNIEPK